MHRNAHRSAAASTRRASAALYVLAAAALIVTMLATGAFAQNAPPQSGQNQPGQFDFYVLALSWSPSFCEASRERASNRAPDQQCSGRPYAFVVHGLWPQYERGYPSFCQVPAPRLDRNIVSGMLDLMPSPRLVFHEWDRHGTCSGLAAQAYFEAVRKARAAVTIPAEFTSVAAPRAVKPGDVAEAFLKANPGLSREGVAVACDSKRLSEVRLCLGKDFAFRNCAEVARAACRRDSVVMPAIRGTRAALNEDAALPESLQSR